MGEVVAIGATSGHNETVVEFITREKVTRTENVANRFGWTMEEARKRLKKLAREGQIRNLGRRNIEIGAGLEWAPIE